MLNLPPITLFLAVVAGIIFAARQLTFKKGRRKRSRAQSRPPTSALSSFLDGLFQSPREHEKRNSSRSPTQAATSIRPPYHKRPLLSSGELAFYTELHTAVDPYFRIFTKVRLWDIIDVNKDSSWRESKAAQNKISSKHVGFVACNPVDGVVRLVIELDDRTHLRFDRRRRDIEVDNMLAAGGIPIIH